MMIWWSGANVVFEDLADQFDGMVENMFAGDGPEQRDDVGPQNSPQNTPRHGSPQPQMRPPFAADQMRGRFVRPTGVAPGKEMRPRMIPPGAQMAGQRPGGPPGFMPQQVGPRGQMGMMRPQHPGSSPQYAGNSPSHNQQFNAMSPQPNMMGQRRPPSAGGSSVPSPASERPVTPQTPRTPGPPTPQSQGGDDFGGQQQQMGQAPMMQQQQQQQQPPGGGGGNGGVAPSYQEPGRESGWGKKKTGLRGGWGPFIGLKGGAPPVFTQGTNSNNPTTVTNVTAPNMAMMQQPPQQVMTTTVMVNTSMPSNAAAVPQQMAMRPMAPNAVVMTRPGLIVSQGQNSAVGANVVQTAQVAAVGQVRPGGKVRADLGLERRGPFVDTEGPRERSLDFLECLVRCESRDAEAMQDRNDEATGARTVQRDPNDPFAAFNLSSGRSLSWE